MPGVACAGTTKKGARCTMPAAKGSGYCYHHHADYAEERRRNASRAATLGNSKIGAEIRSTRLLVRELVEMVISNELHPLVRKRLAEVVQLVQSYCRLAELEVAAGEAPRFPGNGYAALPQDTSEKAMEWAEGEAETELQREAFMGKLQAVGEGPRAALEGMG